MTNNPKPHKPTPPSLPEYFYILKYRKPVLCTDAKKWDKWFTRGNRRVRLTRVNNVWVSTVFLGMDHRYGYVTTDDKPILFETMAFVDDDAQEMARCSTWREALKQHWAMVEYFKQGKQNEL